ncbi:MAG: hypothetical protein WAM13_10885 [Candidatus Sulfotelmatobacter sp.]
MAGFFSLGYAQNGSKLPQAEPPFNGKITRTRDDSKPDWKPEPKAHAGAPNVVLILLEDVGFGATSTFAGPVNTPAQKLADGGLRYTVSTSMQCVRRRVGGKIFLNHYATAWALNSPFEWAFFILMGRGSAVHTLWTAKGLALKYCYGQGPPCSDLLTIIKSYWTVAYNLTSIPGYFGSLLLMGLVLTRRPWYPRWTVLVNPGVLILLSPVAAKIPSPSVPSSSEAQSIYPSLFFPDIRRLDMGAPY